MKKSLLIVSTILCLGFGAQAQVSFSEAPEREAILGAALWTSGANSAGMVLDSLGRMSSLAASYESLWGGYKSVWRGDREGALKLSTGGVTNLGKMIVSGDFSYTNLTQRGTKYNCILYAPTYDMPYFVADMTSSDWKKQAFDMGFKLAAPISGHIALGFEGRYADYVGAKQMDPRTETYRYDISLAPSMVYTAGRSSFGLQLSYGHEAERSRPSTENNQDNPRVAIMRGVGFYTLGTAGGNTGIKVFFYTSNQYDVCMQYGYKGSGSDLYFQLGGGLGRCEVSENATAPKPHGRTQKMALNWMSRANLGASRQHRIRVNADFSSTSGVEYTIGRAEDGVNWAILSELAMSKYTLADAKADYTYYASLGKDGSWHFKAGAEADFALVAQKYLVPLSKFNAMNAYAGAFGAWNIALSSFCLTPELKAGFRFAPTGQYSYAGSNNKDSEIVTGMYPSELAFLTSNNIETAVRLTLGCPYSAGRIAIFLESGFCRSLSLSENRILASGGVKYLF